MMKLMTLILCLTFGLVVGSPHESQTATRTNQSSEARLQLSTSIIEQRYSVEAGSRLLNLTLNLTYLNIGNEALFLDKKSSLVYRKMISRSLKAASERKYHYNELSSFLDTRSMQVAGMSLDGTPEKEAFIILKPGESYSLKKELILPLYDGTKETEDFLHPGTHFLQVKVATWFYFADPDAYRKKWRGEAYLWSENITSMPMPLTIKKAP